MFVVSTSLFSCTADQANENAVNDNEPQATEIGGSTGNIPVKPPLP